MRRPLVLRWRDWPWAVKLGTLLVMLVILPLTIVTIVAEASARRDGFADSRARNLQRARTTAALIDQYLDDIVADVQILALSPATIRVLRPRPAAADAGELQTTLANLQKMQRIETLFVLDQDGTVVASTDDALLTRNRISAPFFLSAIAGQVLVHPPRYLADEQAVFINVSVPVRDAAQRVLGVAAARISLVDITRLVGGDTGFGGLGEFGILWDAGGIVISSPARPHLEFRPLATLLPFTRDRLIAEQRFGPDTAVLLASGTGGEVLVERSRWQHYDNQIPPHTSVDLGGGTLQVTSVPLLENRWTYGVGVPAANVTAAVREQSRRNLAVALGTALLAIVLAVTAAGRLSRPLSHIAETARALASGEMSRRAHLARRDEIGRLAAAFDTMADALAEKDQELRRHAESLERRVDERTTELRGLLTAIPDLMFKVDRAGRLIDYVAAKDTDLAFPPEQFLGRYLSEVMPPEITSPAMAAIQAALEGRDVNGFEYRLALGGDTHHFEARVSATGTDAVVFLVRDITERRRGEERARFLARAGTTLASSLDYSNTVETLARMSVPFLAEVCVVDLLEHGRFRCAAVAAATPEQEALVHAVRQRHPRDFRGDPLAPSLLRAGPVLHRAIPPDLEISPDTEPDWREEDAAMLRAAGATSAITVPLVARGQLLGVMSLAAASSDRKYDEQDVGVAEELAKRAAIALDNARLYREVQESSRLKDEFLGIVSHELRTPLNAVLGWSQVLRRGKIDDDQAARALDAIDRNARAQARLVDDLLDTSRVVSGKLRIDIAPTAVASVVLNAADSFAPLARARGVELETRVAPDVGCIPADANRLQQVVGNLLANALKFTPPGGRVDVAVAPAGPFVEIRVTDTGIGISPAFLPYVFERFRQADSTTTRRHGGLGIGLAIVRHLVQLHGGMIQVESEGENKGATFIVLLPAAPVGVPAPNVEGARSV